MEATSPIFAALGIVEFDALNDLARWLDTCAGPARNAETSDWADLSGDQASRTAGPPTGREG